MSDTQGKKKLSPAKRVLGCLAFVVVLAVSFTVPFLLIHGSFSGNFAKQATPDLTSSIITHVVLMLFLGSFLLITGILGYFSVILTKCFTFDFSKPFWKGFQTKLYVFNIIVPLLMYLGIGFLFSMFVTPILRILGVPGTAAFMIPLFATLVVLQLASVWLLIWKPLDRAMIRERLLAQGVPDERIDNGLCIGVSDPERSSFKKFGMVEDDVGMLWFEPDSLVYHGDSQTFEIARGDLLEIQRVADAGGISAYAGAIHIILRYRTEDATEKRVRLHIESAWTLTGIARGFDTLAERIESWWQR